MKENYDFDAGFLFMENLSKKFWDYWTINLDAICRTQKQLEKMAYTFMEQEKLSREKRKQFMDIIFKQFQEKQAEFYDMAASCDNPSKKLDLPGIDHWKALNRQMTRQWIENQEKYLEISQQARDSLLQAAVTNPAEHSAEFREKSEVFFKQGLENQQKMWKMGREAFQASVEYARQHSENAKSKEE